MVDDNALDLEEGKFWDVETRYLIDQFPHSPSPYSIIRVQLKFKCGNQNNPLNYILSCFRESNLKSQPN